MKSSLTHLEEAYVQQQQQSKSYSLLQDIQTNKSKPCSKFHNMSTHSCYLSCPKTNQPQDNYYQHTLRVHSVIVYGRKQFIFRTMLSKASPKNANLETSISTHSPTKSHKNLRNLEQQQHKTRIHFNLAKSIGDSSWNS